MPRGHHRTYRIADNCGNTVDYVQTITIDDDTDPSFDANPGNLTAQCTAPAVYADYAAFVAAGGSASDNCGIDTSSFAHVGDASDNNSCPEVITRTYRIADNCGNTVDYVQTITIDDDTDPSFDANPGNLTAQCTAPAVYADYAAFVAAGGSASDNCGIDTSSFAHVGDASDNNSCPEVITRTYRIADNCGNTVDYVQTITIDDDTDPSFDANPGNLTAQCTAPAVYADYAAFVAAGGSASDNCGIDTSSFAHVGDASDNNSCPEVITRTYRIADNCGNTVDYVQTITIDDDTDPSFDANPGNLTAQCTAPAVYADYAAFVAAGGSASDNCGIDTSSFAHVGDASDNNSCPEVITRTYRIADNCGNTVDYVQTITIDDDTDPSFDANPGNLTAQCTAPAVYADYAAFVAAGGSASDNCGIDTSSFAHVGDASDNNSCPEVITRTYRIADNCGNTVDYVQTITIDDDTDPVANCVGNFSIQLDNNGIASITTNDINDNSTDNCGIANITIDKEDFDCTDLGDNSITLTVTDNCGNTSTCSTIVTVEDNINPIITCPGNQNISFDTNCEFVLPDYTSMASSSDNCNTVTITQSPSPGAIISGAVTVTLTATDISNNTDTCTFDVIPSDNEDPIAVCQDITVNLAANGTVNIAPLDLENGSSDNCGIVNSTVSPASFNCSNIGDNTVTYTVFDNAGNSDSCTATVTVVDNTPPIMQCNDFVVVIDAITRVATIQPSDVDNGSNDSCGPVTLSVNPSTFAEQPAAYVTTTVLTATDGSGNTNTCTVNVTVEPPKNQDTYLTGQVVNPVPDNPVPPSPLVEVTACPGGVTTPKDVEFNLQAIGTYNLQASDVLWWEYSDDNGETWTQIPGTAGIFNIYNDRSYG